MNKKYLILLLITISIIILIVSCSDKQDNDKKILKQVVKKDNIIDFALLTTDAKAIRVVFKDDKIKFYGYEDKVILLTFLSTWCLPCKAQITHLINLQTKYKNDFRIIVVSTEQNIGNIKLKKFIKEYQLNFVVVNSNENLTLLKALGDIKTIPTMIMIGKDGKIIEKYVGLTPQEMIDINIQQAINRK